MALTAKPISTITYNTEPFLKRLLDRMLKANIIVDYRYIKHHGEDGDKDHIHLCLFPNRRLDTGELRNDFDEITADNDKPLSALPFRTSKPDHWLMYVLHDEEYLKNHHSDNDGDGKDPYTLEEVETPYQEQLVRDFRKAVFLRNTPVQETIKRLSQGQRLSQIIAETNYQPMQAIAIQKILQSELFDGYSEQRREEIERLKPIAQLTGEVEIVEPLDQLKVEKEKSIRTVRTTTLRMDEHGNLIEEDIEFEEEFDE